MRFFLALLGFATVIAAILLFVVASKQAKNGNWIPLLAVMGGIILLLLILFVNSSPKIYRFFFGTRWSTEFVKPGDQLDLGDGRFRLLKDKERAYKLLSPTDGSPWCVRSDKPFIVVLQDTWGRRINHLVKNPSRGVTLTPGTELGSIILQGAVSDTIIQLTEGWCQGRR